jgi:hypothetical protein
VARPDIAEAFPDTIGSGQAGFSLAFNATRLPSTFELWLSGADRGERLRFALIRGTRRPFTPVAELPLLPLLVTTLGRTGSTLLMTMLSLHPAVSAFRPTGYDSRPFAYWLTAATGMAAPSSRMALIDSTAPEEDWWLGRRPLAVASLQRLGQPLLDHLVSKPVDSLLTAFLRRAADAASELAFTEGRRAAQYSAEKCFPGYVPRLLRELSPDSREVFLVRDFRDVLASILAFNSKRGFQSFGRQDVRTDEEFVARFAVNVNMLAASWLERRGRSFLVRYEDLVHQPQAVLEDLFAYLEADASSAQIEAIIAGADGLLDRIRGEHSTTDEPAASTGRWVNDLSPEVQQACDKALADPLREFGYE